MSQTFQIAFLIGRILAGAFFLMAGINHFAHLKMMSGYARSKGAPMPEMAVGGSGVLLLLGGLSYLLGIYPHIGALLLIIFLVPTTFVMHDFWKVKDPQARMVEMVMFQKNIALLGFVLMSLLIPLPWPMSLG